MNYFPLSITISWTRHAYNALCTHKHIQTLGETFLWKHSIMLMSKIVSQNFHMAHSLLMVHRFKASIIYRDMKYILRWKVHRSYSVYRFDHAQSLERLEFLCVNIAVPLDG